MLRIEEKNNIETYKLSIFFCTDKFDDSHKLRGGVYFVDELPSTPSGKIIRRLAKGIAEKEFSSRNKDSKKAT